MEGGWEKAVVLDLGQFDLGQSGFSTQAKVELGQFDFGQFELGQTDFGQSAQMVLHIFVDVHACAPDFHLNT